MPTGNGLTLILDQHKGLIEAMKDVMPLTRHIQCARHIYEGFRKQYSGVQFRELFWAASKASYPQLFNKIMEKNKKANPSEHDYLIKKDPKTWSRAFFRIGSNCEAIKNGFSECFNSVLLLVRNKPLITMLESIRVIVMERLNNMRQIFEKWNGDIYPNIQKRLELNKDKHRFWHVIPVGGNLFEVRNGSEEFRVNEQKCLPCPHSIVVTFKLNKKPEDYIPVCFRNDAYYKAYHQYLTPVGGMTFWPDSSKRGRPKKNVANMESGGCATIHMDDYGSQVRQGGVATGINVGLEGVEADTNVGDGPGINVGSGGVENSAANGIIVRWSFGGLRGRLGVGRGRGGLGVSRERGGVGVSRGRGGQTVGLGVRRVTSEGIPTARIGRGGQTLAAEEGRHAQANRNIQRRNQNLRPRSARIMKNKLRRSIDGNGSSNANAQDLD
ncbi:hypothetical protein Tco_0859455 [Tanacetum coccineum]|uniref:Transposase n=1 Tax=Tanacetum coccineum TaxID=301880 RepID=A0ABQ5BD11_9ASTR